MPTGNAPRTVESWFRGGGNVAAWGDHTNGAFGVRVKSSLELVVDRGNDARTFTPSHSLTDGAWHHLVVTYDGSTVAGYVDGESVGTATYPTALATESGVLVVGQSSPIVDELAIYPAALSATQVATHFAASGNTRPSSVTGLTAISNSANAVSLSWSAATATVPSGLLAVTRYEVTAVAPGGATVQVKSIVGTQTFATLTGLPGGQNFTFDVRAVNEFGDGPPVTSGAVTPSGATSTYASIIRAESPNLYYRFGDTTSAVWADSVGTGNALLGNGNPAQLGALPLDPDLAAGVWSTLTSATPAGMPTGNAPRTIESWFRGGGNVAAWGDHTNGAFGVRVKSSLELVVDRGNDPRTFTPSHSLTDGAWHHLVVTYDGTQVAGYVDGESVGTVTYPTALATESGVLVVGQSSPIVDELAIYPSALSATQVATHFAASSNTRPSGVTGLSATAAGANAVSVSWSAATAVVPSGLPGVVRYAVTAVDPTGLAQVRSVDSTQTSTTLSGLPSGESFTFGVQAINEFGVGPLVTSGAVTPTGATSTYASIIRADGPSLYYRFGDTTQGLLADSVGTGNELLGNTSRGLASSLPTDADPAAAPWDRLYSTTAAGVPTGNSARSVETWFRNNSAAGVADWGDTTNGAFRVRVNGPLELRVDRGNDTRSFTTPHSMTDGAWHHIVVTYDGVVLTGYLDGESVGTLTFPAPLATIAGVLVVGVQGPQLDELAIYPSALRPVQVATHFHVASGRSQGALS